MLEHEGDNAHDIHAQEHRMRVGAVMQGQDVVIRFHFGNKNLDATAPAITRSSWLSIHNAAVTSQAACDSAMASVYGAWWTGYIAACDAAGVTGPDRPEGIARAWFKIPPDLAL